MTMLACFGCKAEVSNGLALCETCIHTLRVALTNTAAYYADVEHIQPGQRVKVRSAYQSTPPPTTTDNVDRISNALSDTAAMVIGWARNLADDRAMTGQLPTTIPTACGWLESHAVTIATLEWAAECLREMRDCERALKRILDKADTGTFAGLCGNEVGREEVEGQSVPVVCERGLYASHSTHWVTCPECGRCWDADERRRMMLTSLEDEKLPVRELARVAVRLTSEPSTEKLTRRIEQWVNRGQLPYCGTRVVNGQVRRTYRVGDVVALIVGDVKPRNLEAC